MRCGRLQPYASATSVHAAAFRRPRRQRRVRPIALLIMPSTGSTGCLRFVQRALASFVSSLAVMAMHQGSVIRRGGFCGGNGRKSQGRCGWVRLMAASASTPFACSASIAGLLASPVSANTRCGSPIASCMPRTAAVRLGASTAVATRPVARSVAPRRRRVRPGRCRPGGAGLAFNASRRASSPGSACESQRSASAALACAARSCSYSATASRAMT